MSDELRPDLPGSGFKGTGHRWSGKTCSRCGVENSLTKAVAQGKFDPITDKWADERWKAYATFAMNTCPADLNDHNKTLWRCKVSELRRAAEDES